jgi:hypothetical protein
MKFIVTRPQPPSRADTGNQATNSIDQPLPTCAKSKLNRPKVQLITKPKKASTDTPIFDETSSDLLSLLRDGKTLVGP